MSLSYSSLFLGLSRSISFSITLRINEGILIGKLLDVCWLSILEVRVDLAPLFEVLLDKLFILFEIILGLINQGLVL